MHHVPGLYIASSPKGGRGVFTAHNLAVGDLIEICPVILIPSKQMPLIDQTVFYNYYIIWPEGGACMPLGYGGLYNHSSNPNAEIELDLDYQTVDFKCIRQIAENEEITIDYTAGIKDAPGLWFKELS